jgi:hypothetical protein
MAHANVKLSDTHVASTFGLWPPDAFSDLEGGKHQQNKLQAYTWECFEHARTVWLPSIVGDLPRNIMLYGDLVDGIQPKSPLVTDDATLQIAAAVMAMKPWCDGAENIWAVSGTEFHAGKSALWDNAVAEGLGAKPDAAGRFASWQRFVCVDGVTFDMAHHIGGSYVESSKFTPLQREWIDQATSAYKTDWPKADWLVRGHSHNFRHVPDDRCNVLALPGWEAKTPFAHRGRRAAPASIGLCVVITDEGRSWLEHKLYAWPSPRIEVVGWTPETPSPVSVPSNSTPGSPKPSILSRIRSRLTTTDAPAKS